MKKFNPFFAIVILVGMTILFACVFVRRIFQYDIPACVLDPPSEIEFSNCDWEY